MGEITTRARVLRAEIETMAQSLDDAKAETVPELFPEWNPAGCDYAAGDRVRFAGIPYKVLQPHTSQAGWTPEAAVSLFAQVLPGQDGTQIGVWVQPDSTNPYKADDKVYYPDENGHIYKSLIDGNVWPPSNSQLWELVE